MTDAPVPVTTPSEADHENAGEVEPVTVAVNVVVSPVSNEMVDGDRETANAGGGGGGAETVMVAVACAVEKVVVSVATTVTV